jgi:hypothetical protein
MLEKHTQKQGFYDTKGGAPFGAVQACKSIATAENSAHVTLY